MRSFVFLVLSLIGLAEVASAQPLRPGEWRTYTSMRNVQDVAVSEDSQYVWAATTGGAFRVKIVDPTEMLELRNTDGLSDNDLTAVGVDEDGNVYLGGRSGSFDIWQHSSGRIRNERSILDAPNFSIKNINDIFAHGSRVYLATGYGLTIYDRSTNAFGETAIAFGSLPAQVPVNRVFVFRDTIYVVQDGAVAYAPTSTFNLNNPAAWNVITFTQGTLTSIAAFRDRLVVGTTIGLYEVALPTQVLQLVTGFSDVNISELEAQSGTLNMIDPVGEGRLIRTTDLIGTTSVAIPRDEAGSNPINSLAVGRNDLAIVGTTLSGTLINIGSGQAVEGVFPPGPPSNASTDLSFSASIDRLIGAHSSFGVSVFDPENDQWLEYSRRDQRLLPNANYRRALYDSSRAVTWLSLQGGGLLKVTGLETGNPTMKQYKMAEGLPSSVPANDDFIITGSGLVDNQGRFVVTSYASNGRALSIYDESSDRFNSISLGVDWYSYARIAQDLNGNFWIGTERNNIPTPFGVFYSTTDNRTGSIFGGSGGVLSSRAVNALIIDQDNALWVGTDAGLDIIADIYKANQANPNFTAKRNVVFLEGQVVRAIAVDGVGNKWIGTENGIFVVSADGTDSVARFTTENSPLSDNIINTLTIDNRRGEAYIGTEKGLSRVSTIFKQGEPDYAGIRVYPNPVIQTVEEQPTIFIAGLVGGSYVSIFTMGGRLVASIDGTDLGGIVTWNGRDENGNLLPSGVYLVSATSLQAEGRGQAKFVLVRKE